MKIELISKDEHSLIEKIYKNFPILTFQNKGFEYINKSKFNEREKEAFDAVTKILKKSVEAFVEFSNFQTTKEGKIRIRLQYHWDKTFIGVGYILLDELLNGFNETEIQ